MHSLIEHSHEDRRVGVLTFVGSTAGSEANRTGWHTKYHLGRFNDRVSPGPALEAVPFVFAALT